jgi:WD40 repeat protein
MILALAFSPGGQTLVSGGGDYANFGEVKVWNVQTGRELLALQGHQEWVECVTSPWIVKP